MIISNANAYIDGAFHNGAQIRVEDGIIREIGDSLAPAPGEETVDVKGDTLLPAFVDVHIHAFMGKDTMDGEEAVRHMSRQLKKAGVAAFLPTTMSASPEDTVKALAAIKAVMDRPEADGAVVLGAHMEAPFLALSKKGAQMGEYFLTPSDENYSKLVGPYGDVVRIITIAPELPGAEEWIRHITKKGVTVSIGHTDATCQQVHDAADWGATHVTHLFNAQTPLHHREPGVPGATLTDDRLFGEIICDGIHLHPDIVRLTWRAKGKERTVLVTDAMEAAGMPDGEYMLGGQKVYVKEGAARLASGVLAGSTLTLKQALYNLIEKFGIPAEEAIWMTTASPADSIGETHWGRIAPGMGGVFTRWNNSWELVEVIG